MVLSKHIFISKQVLPMYQKQSQKKQVKEKIKQSGLQTNTSNNKKKQELRINQGESIDFEKLSFSLKPYPFNLTFIQYVKYTLAKTIPRGKYNINSNTKIIECLENQYDELMKRIEREENKYVFKFIQFNKNLDLEYIEYQMQDYYEVKIYSYKILLWALKDIEELYKFSRSITTNFFQKIKQDKKVIIRLSKKYYLQAFRQIRIFSKEYDIQNPSVLHENSSLHSIDLSEMSVDSKNYWTEYDNINQNKPKQNESFKIIKDDPINTNSLQKNIV